MKKFLLLLLLAATPALADDAALAKCRGLKDSAARLACYDQIPLGTGAAKATSPQVTSVTGATSAAAPSGAPQARPRESVEQFGLPQTVREEKLEAIESTIPGQFDGWRARDRIKLANGQVWQIADDSNAYHSIQNPKVRIRSGALGAFYLEIEGTNRSPRVRRVE